MTVVGILVALVILVVILAIAIVVAANVAFYLYACWPLIIGIVLGIMVWHYGFDNIGVLLMLVGIVGQYFWWTRMLSSSSSSGGTFYPSSKKAIYDKDGNIKGYIDKN